MTKWYAVWNGREVSGQEGPRDLPSWDFPEEGFPWLGDTERGLEFVVADWRVFDGDWEMAMVGVCLDDLIDSFIETENGEDDERDALARRATAISALERAIGTLKGAPLRIMKRQP